ncbi:MAG: glutamate racemase [Firmicutes bacterium]|nr:glutamate racemase [Bacillota bacterium]
MDNRPIGFFDSGLGGLTSIPYLMNALPQERVIYYGDTARTPYGSKAVTTIRRFSKEITDFLVESNVKMIVIACNTISSTCLGELRQRFPDIPIVGIITPAAQEVVNRCTTASRIGVIGTKVTIASHAYRNFIEELKPELSIFETACPAFVPLIEEGIIDNEIMDMTIRYYMDDFVNENRLDTVVLGCTHYPLIKENISRIYPQLQIINPSSVVIGQIDRILTARDMHAQDSDFTNVFYASDLSENFVNMIDHIFADVDEDKKVKFMNFDLEKERKNGLL